MQILQFGLILSRLLLGVVVHLYMMLLKIFDNLISLFQFGLCFVKESHDLKAFLAFLVPLLSEEEDGVLDDKETG